MDNKGSIFTSVMKKRQKRSTFNLSHDVKLSLDMGVLTPTYIQEVIPGDNITIHTSQMLRLAPLVSPVMHKINVYMEYFFVPNRILWDNWETFITGSRNGKQLSPEDMPAFPTVTPYGFDVLTGEPDHFLNGTSSLLDYLGLPTRGQFPTEYNLGTGSYNSPNLDSLTEVNALPFAAYQRIWDEYYRDQNLMDSIYELDTNWENYNMLRDGLQNDGVQELLSGIRGRAWEHDYFTSALPWAQKGEEVRIPIDMAFDDSAAFKTQWSAASGGPMDHTSTPSLQWSAPDPVTDEQSFTSTQEAGGFTAVNVDNTEQLYNTGTINDLRAAIRLQEWLETNARGGSRYFESIYAHFGVSSPDSRLQRPEFIGSHRSNMVISEVLQTSSPQTETDTPQGNMSGHGQNVGSSRKFKYYAQEHGYIIGIMSVMPKTAYMQGIPKHFLKIDDRLQYYFPEFAHLGEQEILNKEVYPSHEDGTYDVDATFGYIPRYAEYKFINSRCAGDFRDTLKFWHMARDFSNGPALNVDFIGSNPTKRIFAVQDLPAWDEETGQKIKSFDSIYAHVFNDVKASRLMPKYGTPTL